MIEHTNICKVLPLTGSGSKPGDLVTDLDDDKALGTIIATHEDVFITVMWSRAPNPTLEQIAAGQCHREIDNEIIKDLTNAYDAGLISRATLLKSCT